MVGAWTITEWGGARVTGIQAQELPTSSFLLPDLTPGSQTPGHPSPPATGTLTWSRAGRPGHCPGRNVLVGTGYSLQQSQQALPICHPWGAQRLIPQGLQEPLPMCMPPMGPDLGDPHAHLSVICWGRGIQLGLGWGLWEEQ